MVVLAPTVDADADCGVGCVAVVVVAVATAALPFLPPLVLEPAPVAPPAAEVDGACRMAAAPAPPHLRCHVLIELRWRPSSSSAGDSQTPLRPRRPRNRSCRNWPSASDHHFGSHRRQQCPSASSPRAPSRADRSPPDLEGSRTRPRARLALPRTVG